MLINPYKIIIIQNILEFEKRIYEDNVYHWFVVNKNRNIKLRITNDIIIGHLNFILEEKNHMPRDKMIELLLISYITIVEGLN